MIVFKIHKLNLRTFIFLILKPWAFFKVWFTTAILLYGSIVKWLFFGFGSNYMLRLSENHVHIINSNNLVSFLERKTFEFLLWAFFCSICSLRARLLLCVIGAKRLYRLNIFRYYLRFIFIVILLYINFFRKIFSLINLHYLVII